MFGTRLITTLLHMLLCAGVSASLLACGEDETYRIDLRYSFRDIAKPAPPRLGPENRLFVASTQNPGQWVSLQEGNASVLEGPFASAETPHVPAFLGGQLFILSSIGTLKAYDLAGVETHSIVLPSPNTTTPISVNALSDAQLAYASVGAGLLRVVDTSGELRWETSLAATIAQAPLFLADGSLVAATEDGQLHRFDQNGNKLWQTSFQAPAGRLCAWESEVIAVGEFNGITAVNISGETIFRRERAARVTGCRFLNNTTLLAWGEDGIFEILNASGSPILEYNAENPIYADVIPLPRDHYGVFDYSGLVHLIDTSGARVASYELSSAPQTHIEQSQLAVYVATSESIEALGFVIPER